MESAMKPVRLASGYSDDATPMSQPNLQPKGLGTINKQDEMSLVEVDLQKATQFTILTSHY